MIPEKRDAILERADDYGPQPRCLRIKWLPLGSAKTLIRSYATYEGLRQRLDGTQIGLTPSPGFIAQAAITSPALLPILNAYPAGTSPTSSPNVWNYVALGRKVDNKTPE